MSWVVDINGHCCIHLESSADQLYYNEIRKRVKVHEIGDSESGSEYACSCEHKDSECTILWATQTQFPNAYRMSTLGYCIRFSTADHVTKLFVCSYSLLLYTYQACQLLGDM